MVQRLATILGGLPVIADISWGKDADTPDGPGEYWSSVNCIWWRKRDGTKGREISQKVRDRAEKYDPYFCNLIENVSEEMAYESAEARRLASGLPDMFLFDGGVL